MTKPSPRIKDPILLRRLHIQWRDCALCGAVDQLSLHHINRHPRDDLEANLIMLCGSGTTGCHGLVEARDTTKLWELAYYIREHRPDTTVYLNWRFPTEGADRWIRRVHGA